MNCIILGNACTDKATMRYKGVSQASSNWLAGLMRGIEAAGGTATAFAHVHDALWPKGYLFPGKREDLEPSVKQVLVRYGNVPTLRNAWLTKALVAAVSRHIKKNGVPDALLTYNLYPYYVEAAKIIAQKFSIPWVPIVLDLDDPEANNWAEIRSIESVAKAYVFLSWWAYLNAPCAQKLHLDGGGEMIVRDSAPVESGTRTAVYAGKIADYGGVELLANAIKGVQSPAARFVICGKGKSEVLEKLAEADKRVTLAGFVPDAELAKICQTAHLFINPRPNDFQENKMIFPSKILFYLGYGVPLVSTWTPGLSPDYEQILIVPEQESADSLADTIAKVFNWAPEEYEEYRTRASQFVSQRSWAIQGGRLIQFLREVVEEKQDRKPTAR